MNKIKRIILEELWSLYQYFFLFIPGRVGHYIRGYCLKIFFKKAGRKITIKENVEIYHPEKLIIGNNSGFGRNNIIDCIGGVEIGNHVRLGPAVMIASMHHARAGESIASSTITTEKVVIGDDVWIGHSVTILPGITIGSNCIVAAGAVVTKNIPDHSTVAGIPARIISESN
ncbi:acyltransferase [Pseudoalteromonas sp. NZS127_1]|uniref:acyltransferase n=1 Tax=Pseudoalteromonas sp. NZS127_1 TaxID=2792074 RepID=UPI0018CE3F03|nr:acyltransferase [Pseudoalteromonas sp. NZS127_1]MBG9994697.1 acyltransferase [Pseudoalteromonas sp. NZS127_1]